MKSRLRALLKLDPFLLMLLAAVGLASVLPARGEVAVMASHVSDAAIAVLFFLHGAKLSREAIVAGIRAWPVHIAVILATFVMFPLLGIGAKALADLWLDPAIGAGILLLCLMPSTVQSSIAFTAQARGNVPAAVCSASASSILGVMVTPALAALLLSSSGNRLSLDVIQDIALQLLLPFVVGHVARPLLLGLIERYRTLLAKVDRSVILLIVYNAFSAAIVAGLWQRYSIADLLWTLLIGALLLAIALMATTLGSRLAGLSTPDEITVVFCGSKKSLASGVPIASAIFPPALVGPMILPLMLFHQLQLLACAVLAQRYAARVRDARQATPGPYPK